jgi:hypothetical protein
MSNILNDLGILEDEAKWYDFALCKGMDTNLFFDKYESDINIAKSIDNACLSCPVVDLCYEAGTSDSSYGVWGGIYLNSGSVDKMRNAHKTKSIWKELKVKHGRSF